MQKKTTIDGLAVRASGRGATNRRAPASAKGRKVMDVATPKRRASRRVEAPAHPVPEIGDFGVAKGGAKNVSDDWSELLGDDQRSGTIGEFNPDEQVEIEEDILLDDSADEPMDEDLIDDLESEPPELDKKARKKAEKKAKKEAKKANKKHRKLKLFLKIIGVIFLILLVVFLIWGDLIISRLTGGRSGIFDAFVSLVSPGEPFQTDEHGRTNVLVFGTEGYDMAGTSGDDVHDGAQLTDSIMIISFDQETKDIALISLPRDLKVRLACSAGKVNEVYWCNNQDGSTEEAGAQALMEQVGEIFGLDFQYWVHVNWGSLVEIIDTIGGITVTLDEDINDYNYTGMVVKAGEPRNLTGIEAVALARARHGTTGGDFSRGNSQQKIIQGILQKVINDGLGVTEAINLVNILGDNLRSNFSLENIRYGANLVAGFDMNNLRQVPLVDYENNVYYVKTATINGISYVIPQEGEGVYTQIQQYVDRMLSSNPAVREGAVVSVYNATETPGVAGAEGDKLKDDGFNVSYIGDAPAGSCEQRYCLYILDEGMNATRDSLAGRYQAEVMGSDQLPAGIYPGTANVVLIIGQAEEAPVAEDSL